MLKIEKLTVPLVGKISYIKRNHKKNAISRYKQPSPWFIWRAWTSHARQIVQNCRIG